MQTALHEASAVEGWRSAHLFVSEPADLAEIYQQGVNLCVWRRDLKPALGLWLSGICAEHRLQVAARMDARCVDLRPALAELPDTPEREQWLEELHGVARLYADLFEARWLGVRLTTLDREMCPRFHVDRVGVRLLCTYAGPSTEWLENGDVVRGGLGPTGEVLRPGGHLRTLKPFDVALLKGEAWPGNAGNGVVHRSPAVPHGQRRIMLSIDAVD